MTELRKSIIADLLSGDTADVTPLTDRTLNLDQLYGLITAAVIHGRVSDTVVKGLRSDASTEALMTIDYAHHEIHDGTMFSYDDVITLGNAGVQDYLLTVPDSAQWPHLAMDIESTSGGIVVEIYEAGDRAGTTLQTTFNRNRNSAVTSSMTVHKGQSGGTTDGTRIAWRSVGTSAAAGKIAGAVGEATERVLKRNTKYIFRVTSKANTNDISVRLLWYQHTDRN